MFFFYDHCLTFLFFVSACIVFMIIVLICMSAKENFLSNAMWLNVFAFPLFFSLIITKYKFLLLIEDYYYAYNHIIDSLSFWCCSRPVVWGFDSTSALCITVVEVSAMRKLEVSMNIGNFFRISMKEQLYHKLLTSLSLLVKPVLYTKHVLSIDHSIITYGLELDQYFLTSFVRHCLVWYKHINLHLMTINISTFDNESQSVYDDRKRGIIDKWIILHLVCVNETIVSFSAIVFGLIHHQSVTLV